MNIIDFHGICSMDFEAQRSFGALLEATWKLPDGSWSILTAFWRLLEAPGGLLAASFGCQEATERPPEPNPRDIRHFPWVQGGAQDPGTTPRPGILTPFGPWGEETGGGDNQIGNGIPELQDSWTEWQMTGGKRLRDRGKG